MTVTRYKKDRSTDAIAEAVLGVVRHKAPAEAAAVAPEAPVAAPAQRQEPMSIDPGVLARARRRARSTASTASVEAATFSPFRNYTPPPGVLPKGSTPQFAMDSSLQQWADASLASASSFSNIFGASFQEGVAFLGYAYLSELMQRPEYRRISERIATEMTRKWIRLTIAGEADPKTTAEELAQDKAPAKKKAKAKQPDRDLDEEDGDDEPGTAPEGEDRDDEPTPEEKAQRKRNDALRQKLREIEEDMKRLDVRGKFKQVAEFDGAMGRAHLYIDTGDGKDPDELVTDLGNGSDDASKQKFKKGSLRALKHIEAIWCYPVGYNANDPLSDEWYNPQIWFAMGKQVHVSRLLCFVGRPVPDILKPSYAFGGLAMSQMAKPYVDNWLRTRQAVTALIESFSVSGVYTNAQSLLQGGGEEVLDRIDLFNAGRSNAGAMVLDKETEEFFNISTPLGTLDALQAQSQEQMSSVSGIPLIVLLGITPKGLNASSEGELRVFYDLILAMQENLFRDKLKRVIDFVQLNLYGKVDPAIGFEFEPLWSLDEKGEAEVRKIKAETHTIYIDNGSFAPEEIRKIEIDDDESPYNGLDPDDTPEPPANEGLLDGGGGGAGGTGGSGHADNKEVDGAADEASVSEVAEDVWAFDEGGQFDESKHKRDQDGQFSATGGGGSPFKSKKDHIGALLLKGTTPKAIMQAMGWPSVSMPAQAKSLGMKLEKYTENGQVLYKGTPMTDEEKAAVKAEAKKKPEVAKEVKENPKLAPVIEKEDPSAGMSEAQLNAYSTFLGEVSGLAKKQDKAGIVKLVKDNPQQWDNFKKLADPALVSKIEKGMEKEKAPEATPEEKKKASKFTPVPVMSSDPDVVDATKLFNEKYSEANTPIDLNQKVADYKALAAMAQQKNAEAQKAMQEKATKAQAEHAAKIKQQQQAAADQLKKVQSEKKAKLAGIMKDLNISEVEATGFDALVSMLGADYGDTVAKFKDYEEQAKKLDYPISGFQYALLRSYINGSYHEVNNALYSGGALSMQQHVYTKLMNDALEKLPKYEGTVTRGTTLPANVLAQYKVGHVVNHAAFTSTGAGFKFGGNVNYKIKAIGKRGADIRAANGHEKEILFKANTMFLVHSVETKNGVTHIEMEEVEGHG